jgi:hypothetical protein
MPSRSTIDNALYDPNRFVPAIKRLGGGRIARANDGSIYALSGTNAIVVRLDRPTGQSIALRIPCADDGAPASIAIHSSFATDPVIARLRARSASPIAGGVSVVPNGIIVTEGGAERAYPVIAMEWLGDLNLADAVRSMVETNDMVRLSAIGTQWQRLILALTEERFTHGDLSPENAVLRRGDAIAIVDYDTAAWPDSPRGETGNRDLAYRHPSGEIPFVVERRDDFAALVILVSLRALALDPGVLRPGDAPNDEGLVFTAADFAEPARSERFHRISRMEDPETVALAAILAEACRMPTEQVPPFEEAIRAARSVAGRIRRSESEQERQAASGAVAENAAPKRLDAQERQARLTRLNAMLLRGGDRDAIDYWESSGLAGDDQAKASSGKLVDAARERLANLHRPKATTTPAPPRPEETADQRRRAGWRVISTGASMARLEAAIANRDHATVLREWPDIRDTPDASRYAAVVHQFATEYWANAIRHASRSGNAEAVLEAVGQADAAGVAVPPGLRPLIREAEQRAGTGEFNWREETPTWANTHPELAHALERDDDRVVAAVIAHSEREDFSDLPDPIRARIEISLRRVEWATNVRKALRARRINQLGDLLQQPVPGSDRLLSPTERARIARIRERGEAQIAVNQALSARNDRAFIQAMRRMELVGAPLPPDLDTQAFTDALERITRVTALRRAVTTPGEHDPRTVARLVPAAVMGGVQWEVVERLVNVEDVDRELVRLGHLARIREVIAGGDPDAIVAAALPDTDDVLRSLTREERAAVEEAAKNARPLPGARKPRSIPADS